MRDLPCERICGEGYGPGGVAVIVTCDGAGAAPPAERLRAVFRELGGRAGAVDSVGYLFRTVGLLRFTASPTLLSRAEGAGVEESVAARGGTVDLLTDPAERDAIEQQLCGSGEVCVGRGYGWRAMQGAAPGPAERARLDELVRRLAVIEGVGHVYTNAQTTDQLLATV